MLKGFFTGLGKLNTATGVTVQLLPDGHVAISSCSVRIKGHELQVESRHRELKSVLHFAKQIQPVPVTLALSGKGVITRQIERVSQLDQQVIQKILPNANLNDFYFQHEQKAECSLVSVIRRKDADELMDKFQQQGFSVVSITLDLHDDDPAYASAFQLLLKDEPLEIKSAVLQKKRAELFAKAKLKGMATLAAPALFLLLLFNFLAHTHYTSRLQECLKISSTSATEISKLKQLEQEVIRKSAFVKSVGWAGGYELAFLADRLFSKMPVQIKVHEFLINPAAGRSGSNLITYESALVKVQGNCLDASLLNNWLFELKASKWVKNCRIDNYAIHQETGRGIFSITIELNNYEK